MWVWKHYANPVSSFLFPLLSGPVCGLALAIAYRALTWQRLRESVYLTVRTTAMVCWLFVGSWTFASVFSLLGGQELISEFVTGLDISPRMIAQCRQRWPRGSIPGRHNERSGCI